jgi:hypothetical protein
MRYFYLSLILVQLLGTGLTAQTAEDSPQRALNSVFEKGNLMAALSGVEWRPGLNLAASFLSVGQTISLNVTLSKDNEYIFLASGPFERADVDLYLRDTSGKILKEDLQADGTPVIEFKAPEDGTYQLQLHLVAGDEPAAYVALSLLQRRGRSISEQHYRSTAIDFFGEVREIRPSTTGTGTGWQKKAGEWCLFGYLIQKSEEISLRGLRPGPGRKVFAAMAGPESPEITLYLGTEAGRIVAGTNQPKSHPLLRYNCLPGAVLDLRVGTEGAKVPSLVLVGILNH